MRALETGRRDSGSPESGYAMMALLVMMAVMAIMMTAAVPVWKTSATREKEAELIFRGQQYARAIGLYQRSPRGGGPGSLPPSIDLLVDQKFLRKKYKDPITNDDFQLLSGAQAGGFLGQQQGQPPGQQGRGQQGQGQQQGQQPAARGGLQTPQFGSGSGQVVGGIMGVVSKSTETSLRLYNNRSHYNEWTFVFVQQQQGIPGGGGVNGRGGRGGADGGGVNGRGGDGRGRGADGRGVNPGARPGGASPFGPGAGGAGRGPGTPQPFGTPGSQGGPAGGRGRF
jgi:type II secretory pathway pseudopilin PulG